MSFPAGVIRNQKEHYFRNMLRIKEKLTVRTTTALIQALEKRLHFGCSRLMEHGCHRGSGRAGSHTINPYATILEFGRQRRGEMRQSGLSGRIDCTSRLGEYCLRRGNTDDGPTGRFHRFQRSMDHIDATNEIYAYQCIDLLHFC